MGDGLVIESLVGDPGDLQALLDELRPLVQDLSPS